MIPEQTNTPPPTKTPKATGGTPWRGLLIAAAIIVFILLLNSAGSSDDGGDTGGGASTDEGASIVDRAENVLKASGYWKDYGITGVEEIGVDGLFVYTALDPGMDLQVLVQVYDQSGDEIEAESCGNVA